MEFEGAKPYEMGIVSILLNGDIETVIDVRNQLSVKDFGDKIAACLTGIIFNLVGNNRDLNTANIAAEIIKYKEITNKLGGTNELYSSIDAFRNSDINPHEYQVYVDEVKKYSLLRKMYTQANELQNVISTNADNLTFEQTVVLPDKLFVDVSATKQTIGHPLGKGIEKFRQIDPSQRGKVEGIPSRFDTINNILLAYEFGETYTFTGLPGDGKSILLENESDHMGNTLGISSLHVDTELTQDQIQVRFLSMRSGLSPREIKLGLCLDDTSKLQRLNKAIEEIQNGKISLISLDDFNESVLKKIVQTYIVKEKIKAFIFDYIKIPTMSVNGLNETQMLGNLMNVIKNQIAKKFGLVCLTACQASDPIERHTKDGKVIRGKWRESDTSRIKKLTDVMAAWYPKSEDEKAEDGLGKGTHCLEFLKLRDGESNEKPKVYFEFNRPSSELIEADNSHLLHYAMK